MYLFFGGGEDGVVDCGGDWWECGFVEISGREIGFCKVNFDFWCIGYV